MPFDIKLVNGDVAIDPFDLQLTAVGAEAVAQRIAITLRTFRGEFFLDTRFGAPWYQTVLRKGVSLRLIDTELKKVLLGVEGVLQLVSYTSSMDAANRALNINFKVRVDDGILEGILDQDELTFRVTESGDFRITEIGIFRIV